MSKVSILQYAIGLGLCQLMFTILRNIWRGIRLFIEIDILYKPSSCTRSLYAWHNLTAHQIKYPINAVAGICVCKIIFSVRNYLTCLLLQYVSRAKIWKCANVSIIENYSFYSQSYYSKGCVDEAVLIRYPSAIFLTYKIKRFFCEYRG